MIRKVLFLVIYLLRECREKECGRLAEQEGVLESEVLSNEEEEKGKGRESSTGHLFKLSEGRGKIPVVKARTPRDRSCPLACTSLVVQLVALYVRL